MLPSSSVVILFSTWTYHLLHAEFHACCSALVAWLYFAGHGPYCNLATMSPTILSNDSKKIVYNSGACIAMTAGVVIDCNIFKVGQQGGWVGATGGPQGGQSIHGLRLLPFSQPWRRETTVIATAFDVPGSASQLEFINSDGVEFATRAHSTTNTNRNKCACFLF